MQAFFTSLISILAAVLLFVVTAAAGRRAAQPVPVRKAPDERR